MGSCGRGEVGSRDRGRWVAVVGGGGQCGRDNDKELGGG